MQSPVEYLEIHDGRTSQTYTIPVVDDVIASSDLSKITSASKRGLRVFDPALQNTAAVETSITFCGHEAEGEPSSLEFRGYTLDQLRYNHDFEDVTYLMIWGQMPDITQKLWLRGELAKACKDVPDSVIRAIQALPRDTPYYPMLLAGLSTYLAGNSEIIPSQQGRNLYHNNVEALDQGCIRTIAAFNVIMAAVYSHKTGSAFNYTADPAKPMMINFLEMMNFPGMKASTRNKYSLLHILNQVWIVAVDHEMCNSTAALINAASTLNDPVTCLMTALCSANGILHFGGIDNAYKFLKRVGKPGNVAAAIHKYKSTGQRIPGVGHRVYKNGDPRERILKEWLGYLEENGMKDPLVEVAYEVNRQIVKDKYAQERKLCINPDLYLPLVYTSLGIESDAVLPMFLIGRCVGLMAHWRETLLQPIKLWRPCAVFTGKRAEVDNTHESEFERSLDTSHTWEPVSARL